MRTDFESPASSTTAKTEFSFQLFIIEEESRHQEIRDMVRLLLENNLSGLYRLRIVNVTEHPELANRANVLATPTLIKLHPKPVKRVVGDLLVGDSLLKELQVDPG